MRSIMSAEVSFHHKRNQEPSSHLVFAEFFRIKALKDLDHFSLLPSSNMGRGASSVFCDFEITSSLTKIGLGRRAMAMASLGRASMN